MKKELYLKLKAKLGKDFLDAELKVLGINQETWSESQINRYLNEYEEYNNLCGEMKDEINQLCSDSMIVNQGH